MSFQICIGRQPPTDREVSVGRHVLESPAEGWDTLKERLWLPHEFWIPKGSVREGPPPEGGLFIVQDLRTVEWWGGRPVVEVFSLGIATQGGKDFKVSGGASVNEDLSLMVNPTFTIWRKTYPRVLKRWVSLSTPSIYAHVGVPSVPPETFGIGGAAWSSAWIADDNWGASGWMGDDRQLDRLPGSPACLVTDSWIYDPGEDRDGSNFFTAFN